MANMDQHTLTQIVDCLYGTLETYRAKYGISTNIILGNRPVFGYQTEIIVSEKDVQTAMHLFQEVDSEYFFTPEHRHHPFLYLLHLLTGDNFIETLMLLPGETYKILTEYDEETVIIVPGKMEQYHLTPEQVAGFLCSYGVDSQDPRYKKFEKLLHKI